MLDGSYISPEVETNNAAGLAAIRKRMLFTATPALTRCHISCTCGYNAPDTLTAFYAANPFGCPVCFPTPENKRLSELPARTKTVEQLWHDALKDLRRMAYAVGKPENGPIWGLLTRCEKHGRTEENRRAVWEYLRPDEGSLIE